MLEVVFKRGHLEGRKKVSELWRGFIATSEMKSKKPGELVPCFYFPSVGPHSTKNKIELYSAEVAGFLHDATPITYNILQVFSPFDH